MDTLALEPLNSARSLTIRTHRALIHGSLSDPATGRTLNQVYSRIGQALGTQANRAAHCCGMGPRAVFQHIEAFFRSGTEWMDKLQELESNRRETAETQMEAFKTIVTIATRYPGTRSLLLNAKDLTCIGRNLRAIGTIWAHTDECHSPGWDFHCNFAAACLSDEDISSILAETSTRALGCAPDDSGGITVIERLLVASECGCRYKYVFRFTCITIPGGYPRVVNILARKRTGSRAQRGPQQNIDPTLARSPRPWARLYQYRRCACTHNRYRRT
ncbi:hypothetical protein B0H17DRAFT_1136568 [Mycena rosella]|uniref:Uncharacterized protein n=1 Tax=Mycena rosella TaxID=1033263 RepID=A0AAD7DDL3_MYCRO|nr:hypothetical protein B0H17DRAFT_1136568 [Mycena rosella]